MEYTAKYEVTEVVKDTLIEAVKTAVSVSEEMPHVSWVYTRDWKSHMPEVTWEEIVSQQAFGWSTSEGDSYIFILIMPDGKTLGLGMKGDQSVLPQNFNFLKDLQPLKVLKYEGENPWTDRT